MYSYNPYYANYLIHYGTATSGRYPKGSGARPFQHDPKKLKKFENKLNRWQSRKERQEQREKENQSQFDSATNPITRILSRFNRWIDSRKLLHPIDKAMASGKVDKMLKQVKDSGIVKVKVSEITKTYNKPISTANGVAYAPIQYKGKKYSLSYKNKK